MTLAETFGSVFCTTPTAWVRSAGDVLARGVLEDDAALGPGVEAFGA
jgi:hypothetical protein